MDANFKPRLERHRWLIKQVSTGLYLETIKDGELLWTDDPLRAMQHAQMESICNNLHKVREYYDIKEPLIADAVMYYADPKHPNDWVADTGIVLRKE